jgi:hypothetical protein
MIEATRIPNLAASTSGPSGKARSEMNSGIVNPMPAIQPATSTGSQPIPSGSSEMPPFTASHTKRVMLS